MSVTIENTPNPNALKFTVGVPVGGPATYQPGTPADHEWADDLLAIDGVASLFLTADFVTVSKSPDGDWNVIAPQAESILMTAFPS